MNVFSLRRFSTPQLILTTLVLSIFPAAAVPPVNSVAPTTTGTPIAGKTLSGTNGTWTNTPTSFTYQWQKNEVNIASATTPDYVLPYTTIPADRFRRVVTATNNTGSGSANGSTLTVPAYDADATAWFTRLEAINANAFDLTPSSATFTAPYTKAIWNEFIVDLRTAGVWDNIKDLTAFCGVRNLEAARQKIKQWAPDKPNLLFNTATSTNYTSLGASAGLKGNGLSANGTYVDPQFTLAQLGITTTNGHAFIFLPADDPTTTGRIISEIPDAYDPATMLVVPTFSMRNPGDRFIGEVAGSHDATRSSPSGKGLFGLVFGPSGLQMHSYGIFRNLPSMGDGDTGVVTTPNSPDLAKSINFLRTSTGNNRHTSTRLTIASFGTSLTDAQCFSFYQILDKLMKNFGTAPSIPDFIFAGDSGTHGYGLTAAGERFTRLVADNYGMRELNHGILTARFMKTYLTYVPAGKDGLGDILRLKPGKVNISYGANDFNEYRKDTVNYLSLRTQYMTAFGTYLQDMINGGISPLNISVTGIAWNNDVGEEPDKIAAVKAWNSEVATVAASKGVVFVDFYTPTREAGLGELLSTDQRHANKAGMITRSKAIITSITYPAYARWAAGYGLNILNPREITDPAVYSANPTRDTDGDGIPDIGEYLLNKNPLVADPIAPVTIGTNLTLTYPVETTRSEFTATVEASPDLTTGSWVSIASTNVAGGTGNIQLRRASLPLAGPNRFMRLRFTR